MIIMANRIQELLAHLVFAAFLAISFRFLDESLAARAGPPFNPPRCPKATAAGFFSGLAGSASGTTRSKIDWANS